MEGPAMKVRLSVDTIRAITIDVNALVREFPDEASEFGIELDDGDRLIFTKEFRNPQSINNFVLDAHANGVFDQGEYHGQWTDTEDVHILYGDD
jgi:hypothetical protein